MFTNMDYHMFSAPSANQTVQKCTLHTGHIGILHKYYHLNFVLILCSVFKRSD